MIVDILIAKKVGVAPGGAAVLATLSNAAHDDEMFADNGAPVPLWEVYYDSRLDTMEERLSAAAEKLMSDEFTIEVMCFRSDGLQHLFDRVGTYNTATGEAQIDEQYTEAWRTWQRDHYPYRDKSATLH